MKKKKEKKIANYADIKIENLTIDIYRWLNSPIAPLIELIVCWTAQFRGFLVLCVFLFRFISHSFLLFQHNYIIVKKRNINVKFCWCFAFVKIFQEC